MSVFLAQAHVIQKELLFFLVNKSILKSMIMSQTQMEIS